MITYLHRGLHKIMFLLSYHTSQHLTPKVSTGCYIITLHSVYDVFVSFLSHATKKQPWKF